MGPAGQKGEPNTRRAPRGVSEALHWLPPHWLRRARSQPRRSSPQPLSRVPAVACPAQTISELEKEGLGEKVAQRSQLTPVLLGLRCIAGEQPTSSTHGRHAERSTVRSGPLLGASW